MSRSRSAILGALAICLFGASAKADWQFTKWGMTPDEVVMASEGAASKFPPNEVSCKFEGTICQARMPGFQAPPYVFEARFGFTEARALNTVVLITTADKFEALDRALRGNYGAPIDATNGDMLASRMWKDTATGNQVRLVRFVDETYVQYSPIISGL